MAYKNNGGVYANLDFAPYQYREYPKQIATGPHGKSQIVHSLEEEQELLGTMETNEIAAQLEPIYDPEKEILIAKAKRLGVPINRLWSSAKLQAEITKVEESVDDLPPEDEDSSEPPPMATVEDIRRLVARAKELGIKSARPSWGENRLKTQIAQAEVNG